jgi:hypothetical protein
VEFVEITIEDHDLEGPIVLEKRTNSVTLVPCSLVDYPVFGGLERIEDVADMDPHASLQLRKYGKQAMIHVAADLEDVAAVENSIPLSPSSWNRLADTSCTRCWCKVAPRGSEPRMISFNRVMSGSMKWKRVFPPRECRSVSTAQAEEYPLPIST